MKKWVIIFLLVWVAWVSLENVKLRALVEEKQSILDLAGVKYVRVTK